MEDENYRKTDLVLNPDGSVTGSRYNYNPLSITWLKGAWSGDSKFPSTFAEAFRKVAPELGISPSTNVIANQNLNGVDNVKLNQIVRNKVKDGSQMPTPKVSPNSKLGLYQLKQINDKRARLIAWMMEHAEEITRIALEICKEEQNSSPVRTSSQLFSENLPCAEEEKKDDLPALVSKMKDLLLRSDNLLLHGAPGTGKTYLARQVATLVVSGGRADNPKELTEDEKKQIGFVQFYPGYDYSNFVEGLKPSDTAVSPSGFERRDGVFKKFVTTAGQNPDKKFVFIIDEVNRASSSAVFGEVFSLLEPGKRGEYIADLQVSGAPFSLPSNLYIIATMNDIDRSAEPLDFAFRRRWKIVEIAPIDTEDAILETLPEDKREEAEKRMNSLNEAITKEPALGKGYQIGGSYFQRLADKSVSFNDLWEEDIEPLLREYLQGEDGATKIIGRLKDAYDLKPSEGEE